MAILKGVEIYQLPKSLEKYIQDKTASGLGKIRLLPFAFPVFVMNPFEYTDNYKDVLHVTKEDTKAAVISTEDVPEGEIWEITNIYAETTGAAGTMTAVLVYGGTINDFVWRELNTQFLRWTGGPITLKEGERLNVVLPIGDVILSVLGVIKYA